MPRAALLRLSVFATLAAAPGVFGQTALPKESPFMPAPGAATAAAGPAEIYELAGISSTGKATLVCIYDGQAKRSHWIAVNATVEGIKVLAFDAARDQATIVVGGQQKILRMRNSTVASGGTSAVPAGAGTVAASVAAPPAPTQGVPQPPPAPGSVAQQETEARMLVSDLLEIGIQQRKAYEEAQKKAEQDKAAGKKS